MSRRAWRSVGLYLLGMMLGALSVILLGWLGLFVSVGPILVVGLAARTWRP